MECFKITYSDLDCRLDSYYYKPEFIEFYDKLNNLNIDYLTLGDISKLITSGSTPKSGSDAYTSKEFGIPFIRINNIHDQNITLDNVLYIKKDIHNSLLKRTQLMSGDILLSMAGTIGLSTIVNSSICPANINQALARIVLKKEYLSEYVNIILNSNIGQMQIKRMSRPSVQTNINLEEIKSIIIPIVYLDKQKQIINIINIAKESKSKKELDAKQLLESIDEYILYELGIKLHELEDKMTYVVSSEEVKNNRCDAYYFQPKFEEVEKAVNEGKFEVKELKEIVKKIKTGATPHQRLEPFTENKEIIFLRNTNIYKNRISLYGVKYIKKEFGKNLTYSSKNDIIICIAGTIGLTAVNIFDEKISINQNISSLTLNEGVNPYYISIILNLKIYDLLFKRVASLATIFYINNNNLLFIKIPIPPLSIQNKIVDEVKKRMEKAEQLQKKAKEELEKAKLEVEYILLS